MNDEYLPFGGPEQKGGTSTATVQSVVVAVQILELLADSSRPKRVTDIANQMNTTKARISRHLTTLSGLGLVAKMPDSSGYRLGSTLFRLANSASEQYEITNIAYRFMIPLRNKISEALLLAMPAGGDALIVSTLGSGKPLTPKLARGTRFSIPVSPTAWVVLAYSPDHIKERVLARRTDRETVRDDALDPAIARATCDTISKKFYAFDADPHDAGFSVLSAPIFNYSEQLEAALTIVMNRRKHMDSGGVPYLRQLKETVIDISRTLGSTKMAQKMADTLQ